MRRPLTEWDVCDIITLEDYLRNGVCDCVKRIIIVGSGGAGKSTLARTLGERLDLPVVHLDKLFWCGDWQHIPRDEFDAKLLDICAGEEWIIDGNYDRTLPTRLARCDTALYLDYPTVVCLWGIVKRFLRYRGSTRPDMGGDCREKIDWEFFSWVASYRRKNRQRNLRLLAECGADVKIFTSRRQCDRFLVSLGQNEGR